MRKNDPIIEIYATPICPYCMAAKAELQRKNVIFEVIDVAADPARRQEMVNRANGRMTVPQIFIAGRHIGGYDDMIALNRANKLDPLLAPFKVS